MPTPTADIGLIGLAVMGENLVLNMESHGYTVAVYNRTTAKVDEFVTGRGAGKKFVGAKSPQEFVASIKRPRKIIMLVKAGKAVDDSIAMVAPFLEAGDILIDGGNTHFPDTTRRMKELAPKGIRFVGSGVSGGEEGALKGPSIMPGGDATAWPEIKPIFQAIAAKAKDVSGALAPCCDWVGPEGSGHFVKMVHNGIEYGLMAAYAEGFNILKHANIGRTSREADAETAPLGDPHFYDYDIDLGEVAELWRRGSVVGSWLLDLTAVSYLDDPNLDAFTGSVSDSGEGRWTAVAAIEEGVPAPVLNAALFERFASQGADEHANRVLNAMRFQFGGHHVKPSA